MSPPDGLGAEGMTWGSPWLPINGLGLTLQEMRRLGSERSRALVRVTQWSQAARGLRRKAKLDRSQAGGQERVCPTKGLQQPCGASAKQEAGAGAGLGRSSDPTHRPAFWQCCPRPLRPSQRAQSLWAHVPVGTLRPRLAELTELQPPG